MPIAGAGRTDHRSSLTEHRSINAVAESFFSTLKRELEGIHDFESRAGATLSIGDYIDGFYNIQRRHSAINYSSPVEFELIHSVTRAAA